MSSNKPVTNRQILKALQQIIAKLKANSRKVKK